MPDVTTTAHAPLQTGRNPEKCQPTGTPAATPSLTIAICTHNRSRDLQDCISALANQDLEGVQVLVIDSASAPDEQERNAQIARSLTGARVIRLDEAGISLARNAALAAAHADWLGFVDDDIVATPDWVDEVRRLTTMAPSTCSVIAGRVDPIYPEGSRPEHGRRWAQLLSLVQTNGEFQSNGEVGVVCGNAIFRCEPLRQIGGFPPQLGRVGTVLLSGEEKLAVDRLRERGWYIFFSDRLCVGHKIPSERLQPSWASKRAYWDGVTDEKIRRLLHRPLPALKLAKMALALPVLAALYPVKKRSSEFFIRFWYAVGYVREFLWQVRVLPEQ